MLNAMRIFNWVIVLTSLTLSMTVAPWTGLLLLCGASGMLWATDEKTFFYMWSEIFRTWYTWIGVIWFCLMGILLSAFGLPIFGYLSLLSVVWIIPAYGLIRRNNV